MQKKKNVKNNFSYYLFRCQEQDEAWRITTRRQTFDEGRHEKLVACRRHYVPDDHCSFTISRHCSKIQVWSYFHFLWSFLSKLLWLYMMKKFTDLYRKIMRKIPFINLIIFQILSQDFSKSKLLLIRIFILIFLQLSELISYMKVH